MCPNSSRYVNALPVAWKAFLLASAVVFFLVVSANDVGGQTSDDHGNTPATATSLTIGTSIAGQIDPGDDMDVFELDLTQASGATDVWAYTTGELDTVGGLYDSDGNLLIFNDDSFFARQHTQLQPSEHCATGRLLRCNRQLPAEDRQLRTSY